MKEEVKTSKASAPEHKHKGSYLSKRGYVLKKESLDTEEIAYLKKELVARPLKDEKYNTYVQADTTFPIYIETKNKLYIPKMYGINRYGFPKTVLPNYLGKSIEKDLEFTGVLYPHQIDATNTLLSNLNGNINGGGGIMNIFTGGGKSISTIYILSKLKTKTIVVVNKIPLMKQWESEIKRFLPDAEVGIIQGQKKIMIEGKDIVLAMLQSLARIDYPDSLFEDFGAVVIDEIHNTSSKVFSKVLSKLCCKYTIGLSATPKRSDGCEYVFKYHIGDIVYQSSSVRKGLQPILQMLNIDSTEYKEICSVNRLTGQNQIQFTSMLSELITMQKRNHLIVEMIKNLVNTENRKILVLSDRREHLKILKKMLDNDQTVTFTYGLFLGSMKIIDLEKSKASQVILASYAAFGEGVSEKDLDTLILITPKKFIGHLKKASKNESGKLEQIVGRIFRKEHTEKNPLIIDFQDNFSVYKNQAMQRRTFYKNHFKNATFTYQTIDLDEHEIENLNTQCIITNKKKQVINETVDDATANENLNKLLQHCVIEE